MAVVFSNDTSLVLDPQAEDAGVAAYGLKPVGPKDALYVITATVVKQGLAVLVR